MGHERPTFGSLFAGIGGIDLGLERAGWIGRWQVEYEPFCQRVLAKHWPDVTRYGDIHDVDWSQVEPVDLVAGGFPCQPFSFAGKQQRLDDDRWLWPEFARCVRDLRPHYVLVENVPGLLVGGGMDAVLGGLADLGYDTEWESIPAAAVGAPHLRYRVWIVAYARYHGRDRSPQRDGSSAERERTTPRGRDVAGRPDPQWRRSDAGDGTLADANGAGPQGHRGLDSQRDGPRERLAWARSRAIESQWGVEPDVGRLAHGVPDRVDRLRALGNAVVPQNAEYIGRRVLEASQAMTSHATACNCESVEPQRSLSYREPRA